MPDVVKSFGIAGYAISFEDRLTQVIEAVGGVKAASEIAGVNRDTITNWRDGRSKPSLAGMLELAKAADVSLDWIATGYMVRPDIQSQIVSPSDFITVPRYDIQLSAGEGRENDLGAIVEQVPLSMNMLSLFGRKTSDDIAVFQVVGDSMDPSVPDGSYAFADLRERSVAGGIYAIAVNGEARIKRLRQRITGQLEILSDNEFYSPEILEGEDMNLVTVIGRVRCVLKWF